MLRRDEAIKKKREDFMKNYTSLMEKTNNADPAFVIEFCNYFQTDDLELFNEYKECAKKGINGTDLIQLYTKRYNLNLGKDTKRIAYLFSENTLQNGLSYHLNSSANQESIMKNGLGLSAIGRKTEERKDYELLQSSLNPDVFRELQPFHGDKKGSKVYYSNIPILEARYGKMPEWIMELKSNFEIESTKEKLKQDPAAYDLVSGIISKYDKKYANADKQLFIFPNPINISREKMDSLIEYMPAVDLIAYLHSKILKEKDLFTTEFIAPESIMSVNLDNYKISYNNGNGEIVEYSDDEKTAVNSI